VRKPGGEVRIHKLTLWKVKVKKIFKIFQFKCFISKVCNFTAIKKSSVKRW